MLNAAKISVAAFDPASSEAVALAAVNQTTPNHDTIITAIEADWTFTRLAAWRNVSIKHDVGGNRKTIEADDCDVGEITASVTIIPSLEGEWLEVEDLDGLSILTGLAVQTSGTSPDQIKRLGYNVQSRDIPYIIVKVEGCPDADGEFNVYYIVKASLDGELVQSFVNLSNADDVTGANVSLLGAKGGLFVMAKNRVEA
ncbi:MAG: hypothetical protein ACPG5V_00720 [Vibrio cyclitrophicus]